jgi:hypothetical protein
MDRITVMSWLEGLTDPDWSHFHSDSEVQNIASEALSLLEEDCHNCKLECLLQKYDELKEKYDALLKEQEKAKVIFGRCKDGSFATECGHCGTYLDKVYSICPKCNKELDWNSNQD